MKTRAMLLGAALAALVALPALAQDASGARPMSMPREGQNGGGLPGGMGPMDTNHDGVISKDEWMAVFNRMDLNHDGEVSREEMHAMQQLRVGRMNAQRLQMHGQGGPPPDAPDQPPAGSTGQSPPDGHNQ